MLFSEWQSSPELITQWKDTWNQPVMQKGMQVLLNHFILQTTSVVPQPGVDYLDVFAITAAQRDGNAQVLQFFERMKQLPPEPPKEISPKDKGFAETDMNPDSEFI